MTARIDAARVLTAEGFVGPAAVVVDGGHVAEVTPATSAAPGRTIVPGYVDLQVNGVGPDDVTDPAADWNRIDAALLAQGVTTWCPTITSRPRDEYASALERIDAAGRRPDLGPAVAGIHLEGPFLSPEFARAHPVKWLAAVDVPWIAGLADHRAVAIVTLAPELPGALEAVEALAARGVVVALGHSGAGAGASRSALDGGATLVTHLFNAMAPLHHRRPGLAGVALADRRATVSVIADLVHVAPDLLATVFAAKGAARVALVTDAVAATSRRFEGLLTVTEGAPRLDDGTIAGSVLTMDRAVANVVEHAGVPLEDAVVAASTTPARVLGLDDRGSISRGRRADLVALRDDLSVETVWVEGAEAG